MKETLPENVSKADPFNTRSLVLENKIAIQLLSGLKINELSANYCPSEPYFFFKLQVSIHLVNHDIMAHE